MSDREQRVWRGAGLELRADGEGGETNTLASMAPPYERWTDLGWFRERFDRGAFGDLSREDVLATVEHTDAKILGRTSSGTLRLRSEDDGLHYEVDLPDTSYARDLRENIRRKNIQGSSFEFSVDRETWTEDEDGSRERVVHAATLYQVGPVTRPAYPVGTDVALRSFKAAQSKGVVGRHLSMADAELALEEV